MTFEKNVMEKLGNHLPKEERELLKEQLTIKKEFKMKLYSIKDTISEKFGGIIIANNHNEATRNFSISCTDPNSMLNKRPQDYELWYIGEYSVETAEIKQEERYIIANATEFAKPIGQDVPTAIANN